MTIATYVEVMAADPATGAATAVRLAGGGDQAYAAFGHLDWLAGVATTPRFVAEYGFADGGWTGGAIPQTAPITFQPADPATLSRLGTRYWRDAPVRIWTQDGDAQPVLALVGTVAADAWSSGGLTLTVSDLAGGLAKPFATVRFTGKGGIEGDADTAGREKRRSFGRVFNVEARLLLKASNVYEVGDPSKPLQAIAVVRDKGRAGPIAVVAWAGSIAATLDALIAGTPPAGGALVAPSIGCVRWWTQPAGPLVADLLGEIGDGYVESAPAIAARIVAEASPLVLRDLGDAIALRPSPAGLHVASATETPAQLLDRLLLGVSLLWSVEADGGVRVRPWAFGAAVPQPWSVGAVPVAWDSGAQAAAWTPAPRPERLRSHGAQRLKVFRPTRSRRVGYRRNHRQHDTGDIAADILASDVAYSDGTPIDDLKPSEPGAQVTRAIDASVSTVAIVVDDAGAPVAGQLPVAIRFTVSSGSADASLRADWSVSTTGGVTATIDNAAGSMTRGVVTIADVTANGQVLAVALLDGVVLSKTVSVTTKGALADKGTAGTDDIQPGAVSLTAFASTSADVACPREQATTVIGFTFAKVDAASVLEILMYAHCYNGDDLDFTGTLYLDGVAIQPFPIRMPFDNPNSRGQTTVTPMALVAGIAAGDHTLSFALTSHETEGPTIVRAGAFLKVAELRAPALATVQAGSGGGTSGGGGSGGGTGGGGGGGGGGDVPEQV